MNLKNSSPDAIRVMKVKEVVRRKFQYNWFLPKTRSFLTE